MLTGARQSTTRASPSGPVTWRRGLPEIDPEKDQSVLTFRVDFHDLGLAKPPQLDPEVETALRVR